MFSSSRVCSRVCTLTQGYLRFSNNPLVPERARGPGYKTIGTDARRARLQTFLEFVCAVQTVWYAPHVRAVSLYALHEYPSGAMIRCVEHRLAQKPEKKCGRDLLLVSLYIAILIILRELYLIDTHMGPPRVLRSRNTPRRLSSTPIYSKHQHTVYWNRCKTYNHISTRGTRRSAGYLCNESTPPRVLTDRPQSRTPPLRV